MSLKRVRVVIDNNGSYISASVPENMSESEWTDSLLQMLEQSERGLSRRIVSIDGKPHGAIKQFSWAVRCVLSYCEAYARLVAANTFRKRKVDEKIRTARVSAKL